VIVVACRVRRLGKVTLYQSMGADDAGQYYVRLQNRTNDTTYPVAPERVAAWKKELSR
jgi:hypothetical protein